ncbi:MAG: AAA family ATPase [Planctomycetota bacterium]
MTGIAPERSYYRYFDLADCFVQIVALDEGALSLRERPGLGRAGYRKLVIQACMPEFRGDLDARLESLFPDDPLMVEDLLYQLCVEVNPGLDIHEVRLTVDGGTSPATSTSESGSVPDAAREALLARLRELAGTLGASLERDVLGQDRAVDAVVRSIRAAAAGLGEPQRPLASFLFPGRTGTGKTELARRLAQHVFGDDQYSGLVRIDCSEFALAHEYAKLIGSPPGYVGHDDGGQLTDAVAERPECVVLFDEVEKAHPKLHNLMLQVLEEGALTDGKGRRVAFDRTIVVMTSNCGAEEMTSAARAVGFGTPPTIGRSSLEVITEDALARSFAPEFLGRIGEIVVFDELDPKIVERVAQKQLAELAARGRGRGIEIRFTPAVARWVASRGFKPETGARELRRVIQREIEPRLSDVMLDLAGNGDAKEAREIVVRSRRGELLFEAA